MVLRICIHQKEMFACTALVHLPSTANKHSIIQLLLNYVNFPGQVEYSNNSLHQVQLISKRFSIG